MVELIEVKRIYACKYCKSKGSYSEARKCQAQGPPPEVLPRGTVFVGTPDDESLKREYGRNYWLIVDRFDITRQNHLNEYSGPSRSSPIFNTFFRLDRKGRILASPCMSVAASIKHPRRLNPSEIEKLCTKDDDFRLSYKKIMQETIQPS